MTRLDRLKADDCRAGLYARKSAPTAFRPVAGSSSDAWKRVKIEEASSDSDVEILSDGRWMSAGKAKPPPIKRIADDDEEEHPRWGSTSKVAADAKEKPVLRPTKPSKPAAKGKGKRKASSDESTSDDSHPENEEDDFEPQAEKRKATASQQAKLKIAQVAKVESLATDEASGGKLDDVDQRRSSPVLLLDR
jgi:hypothetical protein